MNKTTTPLDSGSIEIPTRDGSEVVEVFLNELPEEAVEICELLIGEAAPLDFFHQFALEYYKRGHKHSFIDLIKRGISEAKNRSNTIATPQVISKLHSTLASHYIAEGLTCPVGDHKRAAEYLEEATRCLNEAEKRDSISEDFSIRKGVLLMAKNSIEPAGYLFKYCLDKSPGSLAALLGQACVQFFSGNYRAALQSFQNLLKSHPQFNEFRAAIGYCFQRLGFAEMAMKAFSRVLEIDPENEAALLALGFLNLDREEGSGGGLQQGLLQMKKVYEANRSSAVSQIHLANHFFFKKDLNKAKLLSEAASQAAPNDKIKAEAFFILAKISHVSGNFSDALTNYQMASRLSPDFLPALYGLGQCFLARGDLDGALMMFTRILDSDPQCPEVLRLVSLIHCANVAKMPPGSTRDELVERALKFLAQSTLLFPKDRLLLQCAATLYESVDPQRALKLYLEAHVEESDNFALLNNFILLKHKMNGNGPDIDIDSDRKLMRKAQESTSAASSDSMRSFLRFNEARVIEEFDELRPEAEDLYKDILKGNPNFTLAHLRLGIICFERGQMAEAADHFKDVLGNENLNRDAWNCLAATHLKQKAFTPARKSFERVLQTIDKADPYALVSLGNIYTELARQDKSHKHTDDYHKRATEFFSKALASVKGNIYAAQGLGIVFADRGLIGEAKDIFTQVRAVLSLSSSISSMQSSLNYAHALTELDQYSGAASVYASIIAKQQNVSSLSAGKTVSLLLYLCRALYLNALESHDYSAADSAIVEARKALELLPRDEPLKFNLGLLLQSRASAIKSNSDQESFALIDSALESLMEADEIFLKLATSDKIDEKLLKSRKTVSILLAKELKERAITNERTVKEQTDRLDQLKLQREAQVQKESQIKSQKEVLERQRIAEIEHNRRELALKMKETEEKVKAAATHKSSEKSSREDDDDEEENDNDNEKKTRKKRVKTASIANDNSMNDDDGMDGITTSKGRQRSKTSKSTAPLLSKEYISSSDDEEDESKNAVEDEDEKAPLYPKSP